jgi:hypothetical protein
LYSLECNMMKVFTRPTSASDFLSLKTVKKPVFLRFFGLSSSGRWYRRPEFQKLVEQKLFAIMKGNFSALAVKRIREKSKNDTLLVKTKWTDEDPDFEGSEHREDQYPCAKMLFFMETNHICTELLQKTDSQRLLRPWLDTNASLVFFGEKWPFSRCLHQGFIFKRSQRFFIWCLLGWTATA